MLLLQQLIKPIPFGSHDEADSHLAEKLGLRRRSLLCHAYGLPEAKRDVYSLFDTTLSLSGLPNSDEITLHLKATSKPGNTNFAPGSALPCPVMPSFETVIPRTTPNSPIYRQQASFVLPEVRVPGILRLDGSAVRHHAEPALPVLQP